MQTRPADDTTPDARLETLVAELAECISTVETASPAPNRTDEYEAVAARVTALETEIRAVAPTASAATRSSLRRHYGDEVGYVGDLL